LLILAFDTSGFAGSVALLQRDSVLTERVLDPLRRSAQTLAPTIAEILATRGFRPQDVNLVATTVGPGSFTGLRVGVTAAKAFAYAVGADVLALGTLEVIAEQVPRESLTPAAGSEIHVVLDAQRKELFLGRFRLEPATVQLGTPQIVAAETWLVGLRPGTIVSGAGLSRLTGHLPAGTLIVPEPLWEPQAGTVGRLAWRNYQHGRRGDLWKLAPVYLRQSAAEEKAAGGIEQKATKEAKG
jgi:tRNA threonylcarbamoyladenosine biosynthesis protein TsaB